jgi:2,3-bisphosphoglycerate-independent phosphoglycerate mutase
MFYPGVNYRHILKIAGREEVLQAVCTPPHDISGKPVDGFMPGGHGSDFLNELMKKSEDVLREHPVNLARQARGESPANTIWLFWGSGKAPDIPSFSREYGINASVTSAVDVVRGMAMMIGISVLEIPGVTDGMDNDFKAQIEGALHSLGEYDLTVVHVEAPDEAAHHGSVEEKVKAIEKIDRDVVSRIISWKDDKLKVLVAPDHPTPIEIRTHSADAVPFMLWGEGVSANGAERFTESEAGKTGLSIGSGYNIMSRLIGDGK